VQKARDTRLRDWHAVEDLGRSQSDALERYDTPFSFLLRIYIFEKVTWRQRGRYVDDI
jgi:hypothetical protein